MTVQGTSTLEISGSVFDRCGPLALTANDQAPVILQGNTIQPNTLTPVNDEADYAGSHPSITIGGSSTRGEAIPGQQRRRVVRPLPDQPLADRRRSPTPTGTSSSACAATLELVDSVDNTIRGNFVYHRYPYGWSQGHNLDFEGSTSPIARRAQRVPQLVVDDPEHGRRVPLQPARRQHQRGVLPLHRRQHQDPPQRHHQRRVPAAVLPVERLSLPRRRHADLQQHHRRRRRAARLGRQSGGSPAGPATAALRNNVFTGLAYQGANAGRGLGPRLRRLQLLLQSRHDGAHAVRRLGPRRARLRRLGGRRGSDVLAPAQRSRSPSGTATSGRGGSPCRRSSRSIAGCTRRSPGARSSTTAIPPTTPAARGTPTSARSAPATPHPDDKFGTFGQ